MVVVNVTTTLSKDEVRILKEAYPKINDILREYIMTITSNPEEFHITETPQFKRAVTRLEYELSERHKKRLNGGYRAFIMPKIPMSRVKELAREVNVSPPILLNFVDDDLKRLELKGYK